MRAAVLSGPGVRPVVQEFRAPGPAAGAVLIDVTTAGLGGWDILGAYRTTSTTSWPSSWASPGPAR
jgi:D-arabinose 1-dehydrogenase-like Zn-dependent alcohol dehydrogenase